MSSLKTLSTARRVIDQEATELREEEDAFKRFAEEVAKLRPYVRSSQNNIAETATLTSMGAPRHRDRIHEIYSETVLSLGHYDSVYLGSVQRELQYEFGEDIVDYIDARSGVTPMVQQELVRRGITAAHSRHEYLELVLGERDRIRLYHSLRELYESILEEYGNEPESFDAVSRHWDALVYTRKLVDQIVDYRQGELQQSTKLGVSMLEIVETCFSKLKHSHPVLRAMCEWIDEIEVEQRTVERQLMRFH